MEKDKFEQSQKIPPPPPPPRETRGIINPRMLRNVAFGVITFSLVVCTVLCILAIWEFTKSDAWWRAIATFMVVSVAIGILTFVNEKLG